MEPRSHVFTTFRHIHVSLAHSTPLYEFVHYTRTHIYTHIPADRASELSNRLDSCFGAMRRAIDEREAALRSQLLEVRIDIAYLYDWMVFTSVVVYWYVWMSV